jgi:mevalonate kinase
VKPVVSIQDAPGKVILLGEHTVVYGQPAIATSIRRRLTLTVAVGEGPGIESNDARVRAALETAAAIFGLDARRIGVGVESEIPIGCGLGSSAAFSVALLRALGEISGRGIRGAELLRRATEVENAFHGTSSGIDVSVASLGGTIWFERTPTLHAARLPVHDAFDLVVGISDERRSTAGPVGGLRTRVRSHPGLYGQFFALAGNLVHAARGALGTGDFETLGLLMDAAQGFLNGMGVSTPTLERMVTIARSAGALGAKLTGAGGGGAIIALAPENALDVAEALQLAGFEAFITRVGEPVAEEGVPDADDDRALA